ncbi:hypothetical protein M409DRAFT_23210 [Zasmidium cellare ATCC 36951]|uniref:Uncharacterized protein n=1 Tax=Zasmidium cellare ATCC 36951 TaxID=1080233 RepID=A0A6A6CHE1_ZASCE|nr:uncharacterized protein M409DRAFT_23210 [Zasmidium cellare ATCC 36951]KAF2166575.1 hypothetical protein M409DRAFT_23210 [Zasmidium cellare ATCC 36951]
MASATATATMAAAGFDKRASTASSSLQTPGSGTFPSELLSPMAASPSFSKREDALKTPITPPSAYLDFLKNFSPAIQSPASTGTSARFSFHESSFDKASDKASDISGPKSSSISPPTSQPASQPPLSRNTSYDSNKSTATERSDASTESIERSKPQSPRIIIPPSQFAKPAAPRSARGTPRRLHIPQSPAFSPALGSALSTHSVPSPYSSTPISAAPWSASFSRDYTNAEANANGPPGKVHVRQVVTRTVTYCRTPLDPAPKGKRRKIEVEEADEVSTVDSKSEVSCEDANDRPIKQERVEKADKEGPTTGEMKGDV